MGLDMYLERKIYAGGAWGKPFEIKAVWDGEEIKVDPKKVEYICERFGSWRKANAIHKWFVENVQDGVDDCRNYEVSMDNLEWLLRHVNEVLDRPKRASEVLPTTAGFFFGGVEYDDWYFDSLKYTKKILGEALEILKKEEEEGKWISVFEYSSSW